MQVYAANGNNNFYLNLYSTGQCDLLRKEIETLNQCLEAEKSKSAAIEAERFMMESTNNDLKGTKQRLFYNKSTIK